MIFLPGYLNQNKVAELLAHDTRGYRPCTVKSGGRRHQAPYTHQQRQTISNESTDKAMLHEYADLFQGKVGCLPGDPIEFELQPGTKERMGGVEPEVLAEATTNQIFVEADKNHDQCCDWDVEEEVKFEGRGTSRRSTLKSVPAFVL